MQRITDADRAIDHGEMLEAGLLLDEAESRSGKYQNLIDRIAKRREKVAARNAAKKLESALWRKKLILQVVVPVLASVIVLGVLVGLLVHSMLRKPLVAAETTPPTGSTSSARPARDRGPQPVTPSHRPPDDKSRQAASATGAPVLALQHAAPPATIKVDGKPLFVIGARSIDPPDFAEVARAGFNTVSYVYHDKAKPYLEEAKRHGLRMIAYSRQKPDWDAWQASLRACRGDPTLLAWIMPADPLIWEIPKADIKRAYDMIHSADGTHPAELLECPVPDRWSRLPGYIEYCDILAIEANPFTDAYLRHQKFDYRDRILLLPYWTDQAVSLARGRPVWALIPAHQGNDGRPTPAQIRAMTYLVVNRGAGGVLIDGFKALLYEGDIDDPSFRATPGMGDMRLADLRKESIRIAGELRQLAPAIVAGAVLDVAKVEDASGVSDQIDCKAYAQGDRLYVVAVNTSNQPVSPKLRFNMPTAPTVDLLGETRTLTLQDAAFTDPFAAYETHVYMLRMVGPSAVEPAPSAAALPSPYPAFNDQDLSGWFAASGDSSAWSVDGGELVGTARPPQGFNWLMSRREYTDFELSFEFQLTAGADSGVALRANPGDPAHPQIQVREDHDPRYAATPLEWQTGALYGLAIDRPAVLMAVGEWNRMVILLRGSLLRVTVNNRIVRDTDMDKMSTTGLKYPLPPSAPGRIGFEAYLGTVRYRKVEIRDLANSTAQSAE